MNEETFKEWGKKLVNEYNEHKKICHINNVTPMQFIQFIAYKYEKQKEIIK